MNEINKWIIPNEGETGYIEDIDSGSVLGLLDDSTSTTTTGDKIVVFVTKDDTFPDGQNWSRGKTDSNGYFTLQNPTTKKFLTASSSDSLKIKGNNGVINIFEMINPPSEASRLIPYEISYLL